MNSNRVIAYFAIAMAFITWMTIKLPMPALPLLSNVFGTSSQALKLSVSITLVAFSVSQIFWGPLSDRYGRKPILTYAFLLAACGSLVAAVASSIQLYILGRFLEGFAVGSAAPLGRAIIADALEGKTMARTYAWYAMAGLLPPAVGPVLGGYLLVFFSWHAIFIFAFLLSASYAFACYKYLPETVPQKVERIIISNIIKDIRDIAKSYKFWAYVITYAVINGYMIAYYAAMPYWYVVQFHLGESIYGWLAFFPIASYIIGSFVTNKLLQYWHMNRLLLMGVIITILVSSSMFILAYVTTPTVIVLNILMICFSFASGIVTPMTNASLMTLFREKVTILSAMISGLRVAGAAVLVLFASNIHLMSSFLPLGVYSLVVSLFGLFGYLGFSWLANKKA